MDTRTITVLVDNDSWVLPYAGQLVDKLIERGLDCQLATHVDGVRPGWINFILGCLHVVSAEVLARNKHNLVVHESDLPSGRGFAPMAWQILEGKKRIPVCLIEATDKVDAGDIWLRDVIMLDGSELCDEWRVAQGMKTVELCMRFVDEYERLKPIRQEGEPSWYARRRPADSRLDPDKTIREQFGLLKVSDNDRYPAYFEIDGTVYFVQVSKTHERQ